MKTRGENCEEDEAEDEDTADEDEADLDKDKNGNVDGAKDDSAAALDEEVEYGKGEDDAEALGTARGTLLSPSAWYQRALVGFTQRRSGRTTTCPSLAPPICVESPFLSFELCTTAVNVVVVVVVVVVAVADMSARAILSTPVALFPRFFGEAVLEALGIEAAVLGGSECTGCVPSDCCMLCPWSMSMSCGNNSTKICPAERSSATIFPGEPFNSERAIRPHSSTIAPMDPVESRGIPMVALNSVPYSELSSTSSSKFVNHRRDGGEPGARKSRMLSVFFTLA